MEPNIMQAFRFYLSMVILGVEKGRAYEKARSGLSLYECQLLTNEIYAYDRSIGR